MFRCKIRINGVLARAAQLRIFLRYLKGRERGIQSRFCRISNSGDYDFAPRRPDKPFYVVRIACENHCVAAKSCRHHNGDPAPNGQILRNDSKVTGLHAASRQHTVLPYPTAAPIPRIASPRLFSP